MTQHRRQGGQAIILGVVFLGVVIVSMLMLFNQGTLITKRMNLDNAADSVAYSQAKLAARKLNFAAYTNRSMLANELSMGQMVSLMSWADRYANTQAVVNAFPPYNIPIIPPAPLTYANVLSTAMLPYTILGNGVQKVTKPVIKTWPNVVSAINSVMGVFQRLFTVSTLAAQVEATNEIVTAHQPLDHNGQATLGRPITVPTVGWLFFLQNAIFTHAADGLPLNRIINAVNFATADPDSQMSFSTEDGLSVDGGQGSDLAMDYLAGQASDPQSMFEYNSPSSRKPEAEGAYKRYAAFVNENRPDFTRDRHWSLFEGVGIDEGFTIDLGFARASLEFGFSVSAGIKADGGSVYRTARGFNNVGDIKDLGWTAIDVLSFGFVFEAYLRTSLRICLPIVGCFTIRPPTIDVRVPVGLPLGAGSHQLFSGNNKSLKAFAEYDTLGNRDGLYGGWTDGDVNNDQRLNGKVSGKMAEDNEGPFDLFHAPTLATGEMIQLGLGAFGRNPADVTTTYAGPPSFMSLADSFRSNKVSYEYVSALAQSKSTTGTTDQSERIPAQAEVDRTTDQGLQKITLETRTRAEARDPAADYQKLLWGADDGALTAISSAEAYFDNPLQTVGISNEAEPASLFSPFWDARLREPSTITKLLASGDIGFEKILGNMPTTLSGILNRLFVEIGGVILDGAIDDALSKINPQFIADRARPVANRISNEYRNVSQSVANTLVRYVE